MQATNPIPMMIDQSHQVLSTLGVGGAGEVYAIKNMKNNTMFAAKFARKDLNVSQSKKLFLLQRERDTMEELHEHPNILTSYTLISKRKAAPQNTGIDSSKLQFDSHLTTSPFHLIEYCENGSFITYMKGQDVLPENIVTFYAEQLISCIEYIHYKGYAHLDIKLDNILLDNYFNIRLSDFGSAVKVDEDNPFTELRRGTPKYMAPEVLNLQQGESFDSLKADIYSLGVCLYLMLFKRFPVYEDVQYPDTKDLFLTPEIINNCPFDCGSDAWARLSPEIRRIVLACLHKDPAQRPYSNELIESFLLPPLNESIEELVFEEMQTRRSKYEQAKNETAVREQQFVQPVAYPAQKAQVKEKVEKAKSGSTKTGSSSNVTNPSCS